MFLETLKNLNLSFRELRGSFNEFKIVVASIFLGVFIISAVGSISENLKSEIKNKRAEMLGGNFELSTTYQEFPKNIKRWLEENGRTTHIIELRTMLSYNSQSQIKRRIVELKAVDNSYPLIGKVITSPYQKVKLSLGTKKNEKKILIDKSLKDQLGIEVGNFVYLGKSKFKINGIIEKEPDRMFSFATFGPRVLLSTKSLNETGLLKAGSLIKYKTKFIVNEKPTEENGRWTMTVDGHKLIRVYPKPTSQVVSSETTSDKKEKDNSNIAVDTQDPAVADFARLETGILTLLCAKNSLKPEIRISLVKIIIAAITS